MLRVTLPRSTGPDLGTKSSGSFESRAARASWEVSNTREPPAGEHKQDDDDDLYWLRVAPSLRRPRMKEAYVGWETSACAGGDYAGNARAFRARLEAFPVETDEELGWWFERLMMFEEPLPPGPRQRVFGRLGDVPSWRPSARCHFHHRSCPSVRRSPRARHRPVRCLRSLDEPRPIRRGPPLGHAAE